MHIITHAQLYKQKQRWVKSIAVKKNKVILNLFQEPMLSFYCFKSAAAAVSKNHCTSPLSGAINCAG